MTDYAQILTRKYPGALWEINGDDYSGLQWKDSAEKPTQQELEMLWAEVQAEMAQERATIDQARHAAIAHAKSLGFTDEMIAVMYPGLTV